jgi:photosystem II stability/assembly factor-like uncharacterized protein
MANYYIQGSGDWPFGLDALSVSGQLFPSATNSNLLVGYFGFPTNPIQKGYFFRIWEGLNTTLNIWYGAGPNDIGILRSQYGLIPFGVSANSQVTAKITFNKDTKAYTRVGTPGTTSVNFISDNSSIIGSTVSSQNSASIGLYYNGWHWEKDFTFNTTSTVNYKIVLGGGSQYGDNNLDGVATLGENFIPLNVVAGNTYRFRAKPFTADLSGPLPTLEYEVVCLTCPVQKQNQLISTPFDIYNKITTSPPFSLQATTNSNLPLFYSTSSQLFTLNTDGVVNLFGSSGSGIVSIFQPGDEQWFPASKNVTINIEEESGSCINQCLNTGLLYFAEDTYINLYNVIGSGLFLSKDSNKDISSLLTSPFSSEGRYQTAVVSNGQIYISNNFGNTWSPRDSNRAWRRVAMSSDGQRQTAVGSNAQIYISNDFGETWTPRELNRSWISVAISSNGGYQTAAGLNTQIYISNDFGETWSPRESTRDWRGIAMSSDGQRQVAVCSQSQNLLPTDQIYISNDFGNTWAPRESSRNWISVAMSSNGQYITAVGFSRIYISNDFGETWSPRESSRFWYSVAISSNGRYQTAVGSSARIYISNDFGETWTPRELNRSWFSVSMSNNGQYQTAAGLNTQIYISNDFGETWSPRESTRDWRGIAMSSTDKTIININDSTKINNQNKFRINYGVNESRNIVGNYHKQLISIRPQKPINVGYLGYFANDNAWATYDVSTGMITGSLTPNNVFSYAIEIVASGVLTGNNFYYTGNIDISTETGLAYVLNSEKNPILYTENFNVLDTISFNEIQDFCKDVAECETPKEPEPLEVCYTGELSDEKEFQLFLSGFSKIANTVIINRPETNNLLIASNTGEEIKYSSAIYSGYILYNSWQNGDYIKWDLYNFNFPDLYQSFHLGNFPPYPNTGFTLYYPEDFNSLDSLAERLNEKIDLLKTYPVWYPYECLKDTESGIFLTGELMKFYKNTGTTGSLPISHFNNRIDFISLRSFPQLEDGGYLSYGISIVSSPKIRKDFFSGWSYLIPTDIQLEGYNKNTQNWEILDIKSNLSGDFAEAERIKKSIGAVPGVGDEDEEKDDSLPGGEDESPPGPSGCKDVIFSDTQRNINFNENPLCPPTVSFRDIIVTVPKEECKEKFVDRNGNIVQKRSNTELCGDAGDAGGGGGGDLPGGGSSPGGDGSSSSVGDYYIIRTGWNFTIDNLNNQIEGLNNNINLQGFDINKIYDQYKVSLSNFVSIPEENLFQKDSFFIKEVNLYTLDKTGFDIHTGPSLCSIGADYIIDVSGLFPVEISGIWTYNILPEESGIYRFFKTPFARKIEENEKLVKFNKVSGQIISPSGTGFLSTSGYGVGTLYYEDSSRYFYNPFTESVYFTETLTGLATGFGILSGKKIAIKQDVINQELLFGGRLNNNQNLLYHEIVSNGNLVSDIENVEYVKYDVLGFYPITGTVTGNTVSGRLNIDETIVVTGSPVGDIFAYDPVPTGFTFSKALFNINYNILNNFNFLSLNDNTIIYHADSSSFPPPTYFDSNETLISIINDSSDVFLCTGEIIGSNIQLYSTLKGESGNINLTSNSTGIQIIDYVSGINIYPRLYKIVTKRSQNCLDNDPDLVNLPGNCNFSFSRQIKDPLMTGNLGDSILATGFYYSSLGSGNITGNVSTFTGVRSFFDVWDIATGSLTRNYLSFLQNNFISGSSLYKESLFGSSPTNVRLRAFYQNYLNTSAQEERDVADLIIKDLNNPTLSESGVIFRLNGVK